MDRYFVHKEKHPNEDHEVHKEGCSKMPRDEHRKFLGIFNKCRDALKEARRDYQQVNGCKQCIPECHTSQD